MFEYTEQELDVLREYCGRDTKNSIQSLKSFLGIGGDNKAINTYLSIGQIPYYIDTREELRSFLDDIETLYGIACKYGASHDFPSIPLYREEKYYNDIVGSWHWVDGKAPARQWVTSSFKSFSMSRGESEQFNNGDEFETHKLVIDGKSKTSSQDNRKIPFINVNELLGSGGSYDYWQSDEKEIIIPPYLELDIDPETSVFPKGPKNFRNSINDFHFTVTPNTRNPRTVKRQKSDGKTPETYDPEKHGLTDAEMDLFLELLKKRDRSPKEQEALSKLNDRLINYTMARCQTIRKFYMEQVLIAGNYISKQALEKYVSLGISFEHKRDPILTEEDIIQSDQKIKEIEIREAMGLGALYNDYSAREKSLRTIRQKGVEIVDTNDLQTSENIRDILDSTSLESGSIQVARLLAQHGMVERVDGVLSVGDIVTTLGQQYTGFLYNKIQRREKTDEVIIITLNDVIKEIKYYQDLLGITESDAKEIIGLHNLKKSELEAMGMIFDGQAKPQEPGFSPEDIAKALEDIQGTSPFAIPTKSSEERQ